MVVKSQKKSTSPFYEASLVKRRKRRTKAEIERIKASVYDLVAEHKPMSVRQVFYQLVSRRLIDKDESQYGAVCRYLGQMRREGELPYHWLADNTRWMRKPRSHTGLSDLLEHTAKLYRRDLWQHQDAYVEGSSRNLVADGSFSEVFVCWRDERSQPALP